jgi:hypothetical protein
MSADMTADILAAKSQEVYYFLLTPVHRREQQDGDGEEKPEPRQPVTPSAARQVSFPA